MKLIEALKQIKDLTKKAEDLRGKIKAHSAYLSIETAVYKDQSTQVATWLQAHSDLLKEILKLRIAIQKTNLVTQVTINLGGKDVTKSIAEWVHRRRDLAIAEAASWRMLTDKGLRESVQVDSQGGKVEIKIVRCYNPLERDNAIMLYDSEPTQIDSKLEVINAITEILEG